MCDFTNIAYLQYGTERQKNVFELLRQSQLLTKLLPYAPILIGSIPLGLDLPSSDIDIICQFNDQNQFVYDITYKFNKEQLFIVREFIMYGVETITANFEIDGNEVEIFGQHIPTKEQMGYKHLLIESKLLQLYGAPFRKRIMDLKKGGLTTEQAICYILGIKGNPYIGLLEFKLT